MPVPVIAPQYFFPQMWMTAMEAILPYNTKNRENFINCICEIGFDEFAAKKFIYIMQDSDLDVYELMVEDRLSLLIYGWEIVDEYLQTHTESKQTPENVQTVIKRLTYYSLDVWFSKEWEKCKPARKVALYFCLNRVKHLLNKIDSLAMLDWDYILKFEMKPWNVPYLNKLFGNDVNSFRDRTNAPPIECVENMMVDDDCKMDNNELLNSGSEVEPVSKLSESDDTNLLQNFDRSNPASIECVENMVVDNNDVEYIKTEGLLVLLRLIKLFDSGYFEAVKYMAIRMVVAWNRIYTENIKTPIDGAQKRCLVLICHIYLMTVYEMDDVRGFFIDNMMNNIRFYCASMQKIDGSNVNAFKDKNFTAAQQIAIACTNLRMSSNEFFEAYIFDTFDESFTTLFGTVSHAYLSYVLGNMLNEMNNMNEEDFAKNLENFKRILHYYVLERERSEKFMLNELYKVDRQRHSHTIPNTVKHMCEFKNKFCKGNRMSNIGNYENSDEVEVEICDLNLTNLERGRKIDPVFQNIPNNANILNYVYNVLAKRTYKGWHFAKLVLLLKIIGHELNEIETWRYHPGLTTEFMLSLETKLAQHYEDFAKIFEENHFMEQEFWLTAFYLNPNSKYYEIVNRCGMRWNRRRNNVADTNNVAEDNVKVEKSDKNSTTTKFGLLSSTFDVHEIIDQTNLEVPNNDYDPLQNMLRSLRLPQNVVKDLLTVCFLPRNKGFAWAVNWGELRKRCKILLKNSARKRRLVELNMAEANDHLKFLKIDYNKYRNRPQLDYGAIEEGYEGKMKYADCNADSVDEDEDDDDDEEYGSGKDDYSLKTKEKEEKMEEELLDECFMGTRRTRARTAAVIASAAIQKRIEEDKKAEEDEKPVPVIQVQEVKAKTSEAENDSKVNCDVIKQNLNAWLEEHTSYNNLTEGFKAFPNVWDFDVNSAETIAENSTSFFESKTKRIYDVFKTWRIREEVQMSELKENESVIDMPRHTPILQNVHEDELIKIPTQVTNDTNEISKISILNEEQNQTPVANESMNLMQQVCCLTENVNEDMDQCLEQNIPNDNEIRSPNHIFYDCNKLIEECIAKQVKVTIPRLTIADVTQLRQPKVFVKRINYGGYKMNIKRLSSKKGCMDSESSKSSDILSSEQSQPEKKIWLRKLAPKSKRRVYLGKKRYCSDSSTESDDHKQKRRIHKESRNNTSLHKIAIQQKFKEDLNLSSLSDSSVEAISVTKSTEKCIELFDFIQISSSSSQADDIGSRSPLFLHNPAVSEPRNIDDPLYEEEILI